MGMDCLWHDDLWVRKLRERLQLPDVGAFENWGGYCCGQFAVHREAVKRWPRPFYKSLLERLSGPQPFTHSSYKVYGRDMEYLWHVIFAGTPVVERQYTAADFTTFNARGRNSSVASRLFEGLLHKPVNPVLTADMDAQLLGYS